MTTMKEEYTRIINKMEREQRRMDGGRVAVGLDHTRSCSSLISPTSDYPCTCGLVYRRQAADLAEALKQLTELKAIKRRMEANQASDAVRHYYESNKELCWKMAEDVLINYLKGVTK